MRIWHCETQEQYDYLMKKLEEEGCVWIGGDRPTKHNVWVLDSEQTCVREIGGEIAQSPKGFYEVKFPEIEIQSVVIPCDKINMPKHYVGRHGLEAIEVVRNFSTPEQEAGFYYGNAIKYLTRYRNKNGIEDLKKARKNLDWLIKLLEEVTE